jgi:hypothetical protein
VQWDWLELPDPPVGWGCDGLAHLLLGVLPHSSRWRGWIAECEDQPHLIEGLHQISTLWVPETLHTSRDVLILA